MTRYKMLSVKRVGLDTLRVEKQPREMSPSQRAVLERDEELRAVLNEAAALPVSEAVAIEPKEGQKLATLRAALARLLAAEPRELNYAVRGRTIYISKSPIPGARGRSKAVGES